MSVTFGRRIVFLFYLLTVYFLRPLSDLSWKAMVITTTVFDRETIVCCSRAQPSAKTTFCFVRPFSSNVSRAHPHSLRVPRVLFGRLKNTPHLRTIRMMRGGGRRHRWTIYTRARVVGTVRTRSRAAVETTRGVKKPLRSRRIRQTRPAVDRAGKNTTRTRSTWDTAVLSTCTQSERCWTSKKMSLRRRRRRSKEKVIYICVRY